MKTVIIKISGKVQGVFFRATAKEVAQENKISGWIKNTDDDKVEALITGTVEDVEKFILWCKHGPKRAVVNDVTVADVELHTFNGFEITR